ncbi:phytoene/squalene synthase family protein [soil metagenome]
MELNAEARMYSSGTDSLKMTERAKTFAWASQFLAVTIRCDLETLYTFCRYVDDSVDKSDDELEARLALQQIRVDLEKSNSTLAPVAEFLELAARRNIPLVLALELVSGVQSDINLVQMSCEEELLRYCYRVAGTVGLMVCFLLGVNNRDALAAAIDLGIAMQLTNIVRDVTEDYLQGRIYLPVELISGQAIAAAFRQDGDAQTDVFEAVNHLIAKSETYYRSSDCGICWLPAPTRLAILTASRAYRKIGRLILSSPERYFRERISTSRIDKQVCLLSAISSLISPRYHRTANSPGHRRELHEHLKGVVSFDAVCRP